MYLPDGWDLVSAATSSANGWSEATSAGRRVLTFGPVVAAQSSARITVTVASPTSSASEAEAFVTPTADPSLPPTVRARCTGSAIATLG